MTYAEYLPILIALMTIVPIALAAPIAIYWNFRQDPLRARPLAHLAVAGLGIAAFAATLIAVLYPWEPIVYRAPWLIIPFKGSHIEVEISFIVDFLSRFMGLLTAWLAFVIGVYSLDYLATDYRLGWYWFFYNLFTASMLLTVYANDLLLLFIGWEGLGISSWALIGHWYKDDDELTFVGRVGDRLALGKPAWTPPSYAAFRAIATVRFGDMPMLGAIAAIMITAALCGCRSPLDLLEINWHDVVHMLGVWGTAVVLLAFMLGPYTKSAQVPFNDWLLTAMTGPTSVSALLHSATMVAAGVYVFMRLTESLRASGVLDYPGVLLVYVITAYLGFLTALLGALFACAVDERKVILAGSTMSSLGFMMGITALTPFVHGVVTIGGYEVALPVLVAFGYLIVHALAKATLFLVSGHLIHATHTRFNEGDIEVAKRLKAAFYATVAAALSLCGVPPLAGYWIHAGMDEVVKHAIGGIGFTTYALMILATLAYVAFLARFVSLNFIKGHKAHLHGLHERTTLMEVAYTATGTAALASFILPLFWNHEVFIRPGFEAAMASIGLILWGIFVLALFKPRIGLPKALGKLFERRYYIQPFMDVVLGEFGWGVSLAAFYVYKACDWLFNSALPRSFLWLSRCVRAIQKGPLRTYLKIGLAVVTAILIIVLALTSLIP